MKCIIQLEIFENLSFDKIGFDKFINTTVNTTTIIVIILFTYEAIFHLLDCLYLNDKNN